MTLNAKIKKYGFLFERLFVTNWQSIDACLAELPCFKGIWSQYKQLKAYALYSTDFTHLHYLPSTVTAATDDDKSLTTLQWESGMPTIVGKSAQQAMQLGSEARETRAFPL